MLSFERQVLASIGKNCKPGSPKKCRHWTDPPRDIAGISGALMRLFEWGMIDYKGATYKVRPTDKGWRQIEHDMAWLARVDQEKARLYLNGRTPRSNPPAHTQQE
jgi:hypothetical protein